MRRKYSSWTVLFKAILMLIIALGFYAPSAAMAQEEEAAPSAISDLVKPQADKPEEDPQVKWLKSRLRLAKTKLGREQVRARAIGMENRQLAEENEHLSKSLDQALGLKAAIEDKASRMAAELSGQKEAMNTQILAIAAQGDAIVRSAKMMAVVLLAFAAILVAIMIYFMRAIVVMARQSAYYRQSPDLANVFPLASAQEDARDMEPGREEAEARAEPEEVPETAHDSEPEAASDHDLQPVVSDISPATPKAATAQAEDRTGPPQDPGRITLRGVFPEKPVPASEAVATVVEVRRRPLPQPKRYGTPNSGITALMGEDPAPEGTGMHPAAGGQADGSQAAH